MNEEAVRQMVKEAVARRLARSAETVEVPALLLQHASHYRYTLTPSGGACIIEPNVQCNHCGYCESHGH
jgi:predicted Zn-ribbon and HTH transcriptional regulator